MSLECIVRCVSLDLCPVRALIERFKVFTSLRNDNDATKSGIHHTVCLNANMATPTYSRKDVVCRRRGFVLVEHEMISSFLCHAHSYDI